MVIHILSTITAYNRHHLAGDTAGQFWQTTTHHKYKQVRTLPQMAAIRVNGTLEDMRIDEVSLLSLDQLGHVTVRLAPIALATAHEFDTLCETRKADGWYETEQDARKAFEVKQWRS